MSRRTRIELIVLFVIAALILAVGPVRVYVNLRRLIVGTATAESRVHEYTAAEGRLKDRFASAGVPYPPQKLAIVALKEEKQLILLVPAPESQGWKEAVRYRIVAASGGPGPKLRRGDGQVPEGFYQIESLHPNSLYHLALRVAYPNQEDREHAAAEGRTDLGGDIMIHGSDGSVGCLAMGDPPIEEIFIAAYRAGLQNTELIIAPSAHPTPAAAASAWVPALYERLSTKLRELGL